MPFVTVETNLSAEALPAGLLKETCSCVAAALGKPEDRMNVVIRAGLPMLMAGSSSPCVLLSVSAIGVTDTAEKNREHSAKICPFLTEQLALPEDRVVITFYSLEPHQVGKKGTRMNVVIRAGLPMLMAGSSSPCVLLSVSAIGVTDTAEKNREHSAKICPFLTEQLALPEDRVVITFYSLEPHQVGKKGTVMSFLSGVRMVLEVYLDLCSQPCRSVYMFAKHNEIPFDFKKVSLFQGDQYREDFGHINMIRKVPAIRDGDFCLAESVAILQYLAEKFQTPDHWYPRDLQQRARVHEFLSWQHTALRLHGSKIFWLRGGGRGWKTLVKKESSEKGDCNLDPEDGGGGGASGVPGRPPEPSAGGSADPASCSPGDTVDLTCRGKRRPSKPGGEDTAMKPEAGAGPERSLTI
ncbi:hypothetical protein CRUP_026736 [Coryphaenoides rupestris]|nr:hypothetical protein CRUP_026736 [Coryphaenoides rupestris]